MINIEKRTLRITSGVMSIILTLMLLLPHVATLDLRAAKMHQPGDEMAAYSADWHFYCIDAYGVAANGIMEKGDMYTYVLPSTSLNDEEKAYLFWATLSMLAGIGNIQTINSTVDSINDQALLAGLKTMNPYVSEADLKTIIHKDSTKLKYPWLSHAVNNAEEYMKLGGLLDSANSTSVGGKTIPAVLQGHETLANLLTVDNNTYTIEFDSGGADKDFIQQVPLKFSLDGSEGSWDSVPFGGWTYQKTDTSIIFANSSSEPPQLLLMFDTYATEYQLSNSVFSSVEDAYENGLQLWICTTCCGKHKNHPATVALEDHQRLVFLEIEAVSKSYYAAINGNPVPSVSGGLAFKIYRHEEEMTSTYNHQGYKYDRETGQPLEGAIFKLYERFDDKDQIDKERDGAVHIYEGGEPYKSFHRDNPVTWDGFRYAASVISDDNGHFEKAVNHAYHYDKTFCDGHPSPVFIQVPQEIVDPDTGDVTNAGEIEAAQAENQRLAKAWVDTDADCRAHAGGDFSGVHFHWVMELVNRDGIEQVLSSGGTPGETPDGGKTVSADEEEAYRGSGCQADCQATYEKFIALKYSYTWIEHTARDGYILHDRHPDDVPIEVITTDASESGANSVFSGLFSKDIPINNNITVRSAKNVLAMREKASSYRIELSESEIEQPIKEQEPVNYLQQLIKFLVPDFLSELVFLEWEQDGEFVVTDDRQSQFSTSSNADKTADSINRAADGSDFPSGGSTLTASPSNYLTQAEPVRVASSSNLIPSAASNSYNGHSLASSSNVSNPAAQSVNGTRLMNREFGDKSGSVLFPSAYNTALNSNSAGKNITPGPAGNYSHCNNQDQEGNAWRIYDHRTEGELHVNKRDLELQEHEHGNYDSAGDSQADAVLEGAQYALYAAEDLYHPDGNTGIVYKKGNLVAIGTTDKEGDLSYLGFTVAPGHTYDYETGRITETADGWAGQAPKNLYTSDRSFIDYTGSSQYKRIYTNNEVINGNCWIGRPLLMGNYYIKESTRSEGYELSVGNRMHSLTNRGQELNNEYSQREVSGYAAITKQVYPEGQVSDNAAGAYGDPDFNELFFQAESIDTGAAGFDLVLYNLPAGSRVYRLDEGTESKTIEVGTGIYDKVMLGYHVKAENDYQYPRYNSDGSLKTHEIPTNYQARQFISATWKPLEPDRIQTALERAEPGMPEAEIAVMLTSAFDPDRLLFVKAKVEKALRSNGKDTPKIIADDITYSSITDGVFDEGIRQGETDSAGITGVNPGEPAARTVYGAPVITLELDKLDSGGRPVTIGDAIVSVLDFYQTNSFYSYGGLHDIRDDGGQYLITVYAGMSGNPDNYFVLGSDAKTDSRIYHRTEYLPDDLAESPRYVYAVYSNNPADNPFGTYEELQSELIGDRYFMTATLITDAVMTGTGIMTTRMTAENSYYQTGETPCDENGNPIEAFEYVEQTTAVTQEISAGTWTELPVAQADGKLVAHVDAIYTDAYGKNHSDSVRQSYTFRIVVPEKQRLLTPEDIAIMSNPAGWQAGDVIGSAAYYAQVKKAYVKASLNYGEDLVSQGNSYVKAAELIYPGQDYVWQDGENKPGTNTRVNPVAVWQRVIRQQVKVTKTIDKQSYENTNSYGEVHEDWFTTMFGGFLGAGSEAEKMAGFRFKTYLRSNLERLYRDEDGTVIWQDRRGREIDILETNENYPGLVNRIYTKALHKTEPLYQNANEAVIHNRRLYDYTDEQINTDSNKGYTAILESVDRLVEDGSGTRITAQYNYDKFFDAITVVNRDKWDDAAPTYTSYRPIGNEANRSQYTIENAAVSDMVRQFAITWYLKDEVARLVQDVAAASDEQESAGGNVAYSEYVYDKALNQAIRKAENYLKPFFTYDLDEIYAIEWDSEPDGGADRDKTTLSADKEGQDYYYNTSVYLPYGIYIQVEQQPVDTQSGDFANRHYQTARPQEVIVPTVYASYFGSQGTPEELSSYYNYDADMQPEELAARYQIRFNEEESVIQAHNYSGDFQIYPDGLSLGRIDNGVPAHLGTGDYFALTQSEYRPFKNYYNGADDRNTGAVPYYLTEGQSGRTETARSYRYSSVAERAGMANDVPFPGAAVTADNLHGIQYQDQVRTMQGALTASHGNYAPMLVPYTVTAPATENSEVTEVIPESSGESSYVGYAYNKFRNHFARYKLRIEKIDAETHENLLHDEAIFHIYAAKRNDDPEGDGSVLFYEKDTMISGTREFLMAMGASDITPMVRRRSWLDYLTGKTYGPGRLYTGTVPAGTPICEEAEQIILGDAFGLQTVAFKAYSTAIDGLMKNEDDSSIRQYQQQNVGYLETPQPLGAGVYVLVEAKAPAGHVRIRPMAVEIYSDQVSYYQEEDRDNRIVAAIYEYQADYPTANGNKPQDVIHVAGINVENTPIKLTVEKVKESSTGTAETTPDKTVTYKISGRVDGTLAEIGNDTSLVYAYDEHGTYLGYGWKKGTLEQLAARKAVGEDIELVYDGRFFAGYGYLTRTLATADDANPYLAGAVMTLFDALELTTTGDTQDRAYKGLVVERNRYNDVIRMYVQEGYAGERVAFVKETDENGQEYEVSYEAGTDQSGYPILATGNIWKSEIVQREDTDILYYDLGVLDMFTTKVIDGKNVTYGYDRTHRPVPLSLLEADKANFNKTDNEPAIYAFKGGIPYLEFVGGDFTKINYLSADKILETDGKTIIYHLDHQGNRDALVDPRTGMAYIRELTEDGHEAILVWAVNIRRDEYGNVIARDKVTTSRIATVGENQDGYSDSGTIIVRNNSGQTIDNPIYYHPESGYLTGSWSADAGEESHRESTAEQNKLGQNMNESVLTDDNNGQFDKELNPTYNEYGLPYYYQQSRERYDKGSELYDRNGDFVRYQDSDNLADYNKAAYRINIPEELYDGIPGLESQTQRDLYHRQGEAYILENTWITSDKTPNDPFDFAMMDGQADILKRVPAGNYIMEELQSPAGTNKGLPVGITVRETAGMQRAKMVDTTTKTEIGKVDGTGTYQFIRRDMNSGRVLGGSLEGAGRYSYRQAAGAELALYEAERIYTTEGSYLRKLSDNPVSFNTTDSTVSNPQSLTAAWTTGEQPVYFEGLPAGDYLLEETRTPSGYITAAPLEISVANTREVQSFTMYNDHSKIEVRKYAVDEGGEIPLSNAQFTLYQALTDEHGNVIYLEGNPQYDSLAVIDTWLTDDATDYTDTLNLSDYPNAGNTGTAQTGFIPEFEAMYKLYGTQPGTSIHWSVERAAIRSSAADNVWILEDGNRISVIDGVIIYPAGMSQADMDGFLAAWSANHRQENAIRWLVNRSAAYVSHIRIDGGRETDFPTAAELFYRTDTGSDIRIVVYGETGDRRGRDFTFEYQFDYRKLPCINERACSYLTGEGYRRFDYLPVGANFVLVETKVPEGYSKAPDLVITVADQPEIQHYAIENEIHALRISKVSGTGTRELAGVQLSLYQAAENGAFRQDADYLITSWLTGSDGEYSELDYINGRIPEGYRIGDLKPHTITGLASGIYYLAETRSRDYYTLIEPVRIEYRQEDEIRIVRVSNRPAEGELEIIKMNDDGTELLSGAVFEVSARLPGSREALFTKTVSTIAGKAVLKQLPVGRLLPDGGIEPYQYRIKEVVPPEGYAVSTLIETFSFAPDKGGNSYEPGETAVFTVTVSNEKTKIYIEKRHFDQLDDPGAGGIFVAGAELAIYELLGRDDDGNAVYDEDILLAGWTTKDGERHLAEGLAAGRSYVLVEHKAPPGYNLMKPVVFTISQDGRKITNITNGLNMVTVNTIQTDDYPMDYENPDVDSIQSLTVHGRYPTRIENIVTGRDGAEVARWTATGSGYDLYPSDQITDGSLYTITELTHYSDGFAAVTGNVTRMIYFRGNNSYHLDDRVIQKGTLALTHADGTLIHSYEPRESFETATIGNNVSPENPGIVLKNRTGRPQDALDPKQVVYGSIFYVNMSHRTADAEVMVMLDSALTVIETAGGVQDGSRITWKIPDVRPLEGGYITFAAEISDINRAYTSVAGVVNIGGNSRTAVKTVPVLQPNKLTIYNELTGSGKESQAELSSRFAVRLYDEQGEELGGSYDYSGSKQGSLRSGDVVRLAGNEFITIDPGSIYKNIRYQVERQADGLAVLSWNTSGIADARDGAAAVFTRHVTDTSEREIFVKGESYVLTETTYYSDGARLQSDKFHFMISPDGGINGLGGYDKQSRVLIRKEDFTTGQELPGAHIAIRDEEGRIVDEFVSGTEAYEINSLEPGKKYTLTETYAPDGFGYSEEITFTVNEDGTVDTVIMTDKPTHVVLSKQGIAGAEELAGGRYQICKPDGTVVYEYTGDGKPHDVTGILIAGERYLFVEDLAPAGYAYTEAVEFTVNRDGSINYVVMKDKPTCVRLSKQDISGSQELAGGRYSIREDNQDGRIIYEYTADGNPHDVTGLLEAGKTYAFVEDLAPMGYAYTEAVEFTVSLDGRIDLVVMKDKPTHVVVAKQNPGAELLGGAILQVQDEQGYVVAEFETVTGQTYEIIAELEAGKTYILHEKTAPYGYQHAADISFAVSRDGSVDTITMTDYRIRRSGNVTPQEPKEEPAAGRITLHYNKDSAVPGVEFVHSYHELARTGDNSNQLFWLISSLIFLLAFIILKYRKKRKLRAVCVVIWTMLFCCQAVILHSFITYGFYPEANIGDTVTTESAEWESVNTGMQNRTLTGQVICRDVEGVDEVPRFIPLEITNVKTGIMEKIYADVVQQEIVDESWASDFQLPVIFHGYPSERYELGTLTVYQGAELATLKQQEERLLDYLELSHDDYKIHQIKWNGEPYLAASGEWCRAAVASGEKKLRTYQLTYAKTVRMDGYDMGQFTISLPIVEEREPLGRQGIRRYISRDSVAEPDGISRPEAARLPDEALERLRKVIIISIGVSFIIGLLATVLWLLTLKKIRNRRNNRDDFLSQ